MSADDAPPPRLRAGLAAVADYRPGRPAAPGAHKMSSNEVADPPSPAVLDAIAAAAASGHRYPDLLSTRLVTALADRADVSPDTVVVGTGSVALAGQAALVAAGPGDEVVYAWRSFESYPIVTALAGATARTVPLTADARHDLSAMAAAITPATRLVFVCSPNNPTGPAVGAEELDRFLHAVPREVLVVLDEAYTEFVTDPSAADGMRARSGRANVVVLRTFSKAYGLAGLRVGYAVAHPVVAAALRKAAVPFGVSAMAEAAALASLGEPDRLAGRVAAVVAGRQRVVGGLRALGWSVPDAQGNFVWLATGARTDAVAATLEAAGVVVRPFSGEGCRVTVGDDAADSAFLAAIAGVGDPAGF